MYGHVEKLAKTIAEGAKETGAEVKLFKVAETLPKELLEKSGAKQDPNVPVITAPQLLEADGFLFGFPTRYGMMASQMKAFWDSTGGIWAKGGLVGKPVSTFTSTASIHGGQETTHLTSIPIFVHHGMIYVPPGYTNPIIFDISSVNGGSPYGSSTIAGGDGKKQPTQNDLDYARYQGKYFATFVNTLVTGRKALQ